MFKDNEYPPLNKKIKELFNTIQTSNLDEKKKRNQSFKLLKQNGLFGDMSKLSQGKFQRLRNKMLGFYGDEYSIKLYEKQILGSRKYGKNHKEERDKWRKDYYEKNKEEILEKDREYSKRRYEKNKETIKEYNDEYRNRNKENIKELSKDYYEKNKDKIKEYRDTVEYKKKRKKWEEDNREELNRKSRERYERKKNWIKERMEKGKNNKGLIIRSGK